MKYKPCGKKLYHSRKEAKQNAKHLHKIRWSKNKNNVYFCEACDAWHLTSWTKKQQIKYG